MLRVEGVKHEAEASRGSGNDAIEKSNSTREMKRLIPLECIA